MDTVTIVSNEPGKIVFDLKPYYLLGMRINRSTKGNHIRSVRILLPGWDETNYDDQQPPFDDAPKYRFLMDHIGATAIAQAAPAAAAEQASLQLQRQGRGIAITFPRAAGRATVRLLDPAGRVVRTLLRGPVSAGQTLRFGLTPGELAAGMYLVEVRGRDARLCTRLPAMQ